MFLKGIGIWGANIPGLFLIVLLATSALAQRKPGNPLEHLPNNAEVLTYFGERADISPDNQHIAFMSKSFGDAFTIDLEKRHIRCLTCSVPGAAFLRVMHLVSGDYILIGPERFSDIRTGRQRENELWFLSKQPGSKPIRFGQKISEGAAISKRNLKIAFAVVAAQDPSLAAAQSQLFVADVDISGRAPRLLNQKMVYESRSNDCRIEPQDFFDDDKRLTFTCYEPQGLASVMTLDLGTAKAENMSNKPGTYNEVEGILPGGQYTLVEADRQVDQLGGNRGSGNIDIWKLRLDGTGKDFERLTFFNDYEGGKASNPVVSTDGRFMAFQLARTTDEAGVGYGIILFQFQ
jgi:hypothetical protein